jgi:hypothetical protein
MIEHWCAGKTAYPTKAKAIARIRCQQKTRRRRRDSFHMTLVPYRCLTCDQWHVGGSGHGVTAVDQKGHPVRKKPPTPPKRREDDGNAERRAEAARQASLSAMWADAEAQGRPKFEREPRP